jgi:hypothetical protein
MGLDVSACLFYRKTADDMLTLFDRQNNLKLGTHTDVAYEDFAEASDESSWMTALQVK